MENRPDHTSYTSEEYKDLTCLYEITKKLAAAVDMKSCLEQVVEVLAVGKKMESGTVTIINPASGHLEIEVAHGISESANERGGTSSAKG